MNKYKIRNLVFLMVWVCTPVLATGLPPEHEATRLMLAIEQSVESSEWLKARDQMRALRELSEPLPEEFLYFSGLVNQALGAFEAAQQNFEAYVVEAGRKGDYYQQSLLQITRLEERIKQSTEPAVQEAEISPAEQQSPDGYIQSLQALYLTDDPMTALVMQINSLLSAHAYTGSRIKTAGERSGVQYSLAVDGQNLMLQERNYEKGAPTLKMLRLNVLGMDPFVKTGCSQDEFACWLYHPANQYERWIMIDRDEMVVRELGDAMSRLIRLIQQRG